MAQVIGENTKRNLFWPIYHKKRNTKRKWHWIHIKRVFDEEHIYFDNIKIADQKEIVSGGHYEN